MTAQQRFLRTSIAPAAAALIALGAFDAHALSMGKVRVQSALGQGLVAEIDLADLSEEDAKSLKSSLAAPSAFTGMGLDYNPALNGTQIALLRRANGSRYLKLSNNRPLNDPLIDIVVELSWASGRIVRTYTILLDPPKAQESASAASLPAPVAETPVVTTAPTGTPAAAPAAQAAPLASAPAPQAAPAPAVAANPAAPKAAAMAAPAVNPPTTSDSDRKRVRVRSGDTAGKLARSMAPEGVTVEQMLVAMLSTNPSAFADGNVNRLRANAELVTPDTALAKKITQGQARQIIDSQNQDFQALRRGLASQSPVAPAPTKQSEAAGPVTKPTPPSEPKAAPSDSLKLSKGSLQDKADKASMEQIAQQRAKTEASERARELAKNIEELNQLAKVAAKPELAAPAVSAVPVADIAVPASPVSAPAPAPAKSTGPAVTSGLPTAPAAPSSGGLLDTALQSPAISGLVVALLGLLAGFGWYRRRQGQQSAFTSTAGEGQWSSTASTSFEGGGGGRVDTSDIGTAALSSTFYPDSQLEVAQELDPVAEAEVYLAYGKDVPAEEILKEGLQQDPTRVAIHLKLLGIFAKRGDAKSFDSMAREVGALVQSSGPDWVQVQEMGRSLDPSNPLYGLPGAPEAEVGTPDGTDYQQSMFSLDAESLQALSAGSSAKVSVAEKAPSVSAEPSFDLSSIALEPAPSPQAAPAAPGTDRLGATLALAEQFLEIGEKEGARALLEEVISGDDGSLRQRATSLLSKAE